MTATELAGRLGVSVDSFYRTRARYHLDDGMPAPLTRHRPFRWDRATIEAWLGRHHPAAPVIRTIANDSVPVAAPQNDAEWRDHLARAYP